jgi:hypothetical protein
MVVTLPFPFLALARQTVRSPFTLAMDGCAASVVRAAIFNGTNKDKGSSSCVPHTENYYKLYSYQKKKKSTTVHASSVMQSGSTVYANILQYYLAIDVVVDAIYSTTSVFHIGNWTVFLNLVTR